MYIVVHRTKKKDAIEVMTWVRDEVLKDFKSIITQPYESVIDVGPNLIRIDFRCGEWEKMAGIRPDYYNAYNREVRQMLEMGACKCNGSELSSLRDIRDVIIEYLKSITTEVKKDETDI